MLKMNNVLRMFLLDDTIAHGLKKMLDLLQVNKLGLFCTYLYQPCRKGTQGIHSYML